MFAKQIPFSVFVAVTMPEIALGSSLHTTRAMAQLEAEQPVRPAIHAPHFWISQVTPA